MKKYLENNPLKSKCNASIRIDVVNAATGVSAHPQRLEDVQLEVNTGTPLLVILWCVHCTSIQCESVQRHSAAAIAQTPLVNSEAQHCNCTCSCQCWMGRNMHLCMRLERT